MNRTTKLAFLVAAAVAVLDQATKFLAVQLLSGEGRVDVLGDLFHLELYRNFAGPGGRFEGHVVLISIFTVIAVAVLFLIATRVRTTGSALAVGLLLGGGIGNGLDRLLRAPGPFEGGVVEILALHVRADHGAAQAEGADCAPQLVDRALRCLHRQGRDAEEALGMRPRELGDLVVLQRRAGGRE